jgi:hypothetical protein
LVDISSKVSFTYSLGLFSVFIFWFRTREGYEATMTCKLCSGNHQTQRSKKVQGGGNAFAFQHQERWSLCHVWGSFPHITNWRPEEKDQGSSWLGCWN